MALYERAKSLVQTTAMDQDEANVTAASEVVELAQTLPVPTVSHLADTAKQLEEAIAAAAEQEAEPALA